MTIQHWKSLGATFDYKGQSIFYIHQNHKSDSTIVFIHGFPTSSWDWWKIWNLQNNDYNLLCFDMIGFGYSDKPKSYPYTIVDQAHLLEQLLKHLGIKKIHLFAHDYGDSVAQEILFRKTYNNSASSFYSLQSICFLNGGMLPHVYYPRLIQKILASQIGPFIYKFITKRSLRSNFNAIFGPDTQPSNQDIDDFWALISYNNGQRAIPGIIQYMKERYRNFDRWVKAMQDSQIPLRLINGNYDSISGKHLADKYLEIIPNPDVVNLVKIGHYPNFESPEQVNQHYHEFLKNMVST